MFQTLFEEPRVTILCFLISLYFHTLDDLKKSFLFITLSYGITIYFFHYLKYITDVEYTINDGDKMPILKKEYDNLYLNLCIYCIKYFTLNKIFKDLEKRVKIAVIMLMMYINISDIME